MCVFMFESFCQYRLTGLRIQVSLSTVTCTRQHPLRTLSSAMVLLVNPGAWTSLGPKMIYKPDSTGKLHKFQRYHYVLRVSNYRSVHPFYQPCRRPGLAGRGDYGLCRFALFSDPVGGGMSPGDSKSGGLDTSTPALIEGVL